MTGPAFLPLASRFTTIFAQACEDLRQENIVPYVFPGYAFLFFFSLFLFPFSFLFAAVFGLLMGLLAVKKKNFQESVIEMSKIYHGEATGNGRKFSSEFFTQLFVHITGAFRLSTLIWVLLKRSFPPAKVEYR